MSAYIGNGPYECYDCKEKYDMIFCDKRIYGDIQTDFANFSQCDSCAMKEQVKNLLHYVDVNRIPESDRDSLIELAKLVFARLM